MTVEIHEDRIILQAHSEHEQSALKRILGQTVKVEYADWEQSPDKAVIKTSKDDWGT